MPSLLGSKNYDYCLPPYYKTLLSDVKYFIVENARTARRFLKPGGYLKDFDDITFFVLNKHTHHNDFNTFLEPAQQGSSVVLLSEAGCPCIADPGASIVSLAHSENIRVVPLVGPSSIMLALMASGFNGQHFKFHGYLSVKSHERAKQLAMLEKNMYNLNQTQIFIETPFRNQALLEAILNQAKNHTRLCLAVDITTPEEFIKTDAVLNWRKKIPQINKRQVVFLLYK